MRWIWGFMAVALAWGVARPGGAWAAADDAVPECCRHKVARAPAIIAAVFRKAEAPSTVKMAPRVDRLEAETSASRVLWVNLDFTTSASAVQAEYSAKVMGLDEVWDGFAKQSGYVLLIDARTRKPLRKLTIDQSEVEMRGDLAAALDEAAKGEQAATEAARSKDLSALVAGADSKHIGGGVLH